MPWYCGIGPSARAAVRPSARSPSEVAVTTSARRMRRPVLGSGLEAGREGPPEVEQGVDLPTAVAGCPILAAQNSACAGSAEHAALRAGLRRAERIDLRRGDGGREVHASQGRRVLKMHALHADVHAGAGGGNRVVPGEVVVAVDVARASGVGAKRRRIAGRRAQVPGRPVSLLQIAADLGAAVRVDTVVREGT